MSPQPSGYGLTARQRELLSYIATREIPPTYRQMMQALRLSSTARIYDLLNKLAERGRIIRQFDHNGNTICGSIRVVEPILINGQRYRFIPKSRAG